MRLIDADALIEKCGEWYVEQGPEDGFIGTIKQLIDTQPTIQSEQQWVPCSERLPEEREWIGTKMFGTTISDEVYVTFEAPDGQRFTKHISFQNGKLSPADEKTMQVWFKGAKTIAWKQQPEPYQGGGEADE